MFAKMRKAFRAVPKFIRTSWLVLGVTFALLLAVEASAQIFYFLRQASQIQALGEASDRPDQQVAYLREAASALWLEWDPFTSWKFQPTAGQFVNVDVEGRRKTWASPSASSTRPAVRVFMFGGSTLWGYGARDEHTIPSELAKILDQRFPGQVAVSNFAVPGYMSSQEVVVLERRLKLDDAPDVVVFYDGFNDVLSAFANNRPGVPLWDFHQRLGTLTRFWKRSGTHQAMRSLAWRINPSLAGADGPSPSNVETLAKECLSEYLGNVKLVEKLGQAYGFDSQFFWQPVVFNKPRRSPAEEKSRRNEVLTIGGYEFRAPAEAVEEFFLLENRFVAEALSKQRRTNIVDLSNAFDSEKDELFIDACHLTEQGNAKIADRMADSVGKLVAERLAARPRTSPSN